MAVKGKGKQIAGKAPASSPSTSSGKRKKPVSGAQEGRRKRRPGVLQFFDDAARDADYDEEEEDNGDEDDLDFDDEDLDLDFSKESRPEGKECKGAGKSHYVPIFVKEEELSGDELEELIKERYGRGSEYVVYDKDPKERDTGVSIEHSAEDPNIWRVKCMAGREQQIVLCLMHKFADLERRGTKMEIISAFTLEHVKGYVYIEADKACDVVEACKGFFNIYPASAGLVPGTEIPHLLSIRNKACAISKGTWVRMKNGRYKGDLGQVVDYDDVRRRATIKLVPRVDLQAIAKKYGGGVSLKEAAIPAPRLISSHELEHFRPHVEIKHDRHSGEYFEVLDGLMLKDGYLYKKVSITSIVYWGVQPSKDELLKFTETSKKEEEDVSWLSSVYNVRKKMKSSEASDLQGASERGKVFNLHDLVLFGRKAFGVIIDIGKDGIKILKGDIEGQEVMTLKTQDIKGTCVDKMFTASDRHRKTVYINDVVKVLDGPLEGRQGIVRHMYRGTLFIYDENQEENSGIFCTKSDLCESISPPKDSFGKAGNKSGSSFNQSPVRSYEQEDSSCTFSRNRRSESNQTFSIGQTLRIRKGPLKGYLCRVVGIYRSDVTVKLDSLVKVITVEEQFLSVPNLKRDVTAEMPSDIFGTQERLIGGLSGSGEQTMGTSSWDVGSSSWQALSTSTFSFATSNDQKADQETGADPWGSKLAPAVKEKEQGADPWGSKVLLAAKDQGGSDPWGSKLVPGTGEQGQRGAVPWGSKVAVTPTDKEQWADPWRAKSTLGDSSHSDKALDSWEKAPSISGEQNSAWNKAAGGGCEKDGDGWNRPVKTTPPSGISSSDQEQGADPWDTNVSVAQKDHKQGADPWSSKASLAAEDQGGADPWGSKLSTRTRVDADPWSSKVSLAAEDQGGADPWGSKLSTRTREQGQSADPWASKMAGTSKDKDEKADPWGCKVGLGDSSHSDRTPGKASNSDGEQNTSWNKAAAGGWENDGEGWNQPSLRSTRVASADTSGVNAASGWESAAMGTKSAVGHGGEPSNWDKTKVSSDGPSGWDTAGWGKAGSSTKVGTDGWNSPKSSGGDRVSNWQNVDNGDSGKPYQRDSWDKPSDFKGGRGFGRGRGRGRNSWDKLTDSDCGQGSGWGRGSDGNDGAGSSQGQDKGWNRQRDFDGGWGSSRGRGQYGGRGTGDEDDQDRSGDFGGGWGSGRGRGRGRYGGKGSRDEENQDGPGDFIGGWESGRGRGQYGGRGSKDEDNQDSAGSFGGSWGSGRGRGRGRYAGRGTRDEDNQDSVAGFGGGWGSGRGGGRGRYGGRGTSGDDNQNSPGDFGGGWGSGSGRGGGWREQEQGADPWASNVAGVTTDKEQRADRWGGKEAFADSSHSDKAFDSWAKASNTSEDQNSTWNKGARGCEKDGDGWSKSSVKGTPSGVSLSDKEQGADPWGNKVSDAARDHKQGADPWGSKAPLAAEGQGRADPWGSKLPAGAQEQEQGADPWGSNVAGASRDKEQKADAWGGSKSASGDSSHFDEALDNSWSKATNTGGEQNSSWNKPSEKDGDGWNKPSEKNTPVTPSSIASSGRDLAFGWENADMATKSAGEHGGEPSGWDKVKVSSDGLSEWDTAGRDKEGLSSKNGTDGWNPRKSAGRDQVSSWKKGGDENAWKSGGDEGAWKSNQMDSWDKPSGFEGGRGFGRGRCGNSWDKPMDRDGGQGSGWGGGSGWGDGAGSSQGQDNNGWNRQRYSDGGRGFSRGRGRGWYGGRGGRGDEDNQGGSGNFGGGGGWGSGRGRGRDWNGDSGNNFGRGGRGRGGGTFQSFDRD